MKETITQTEWNDYTKKGFAFIFDGKRYVLKVFDKSPILVEVIIEEESK